MLTSQATGYTKALDARRHSGGCGICDHHPATTDGPQRHCPVHGPAPTWVDYDRLSWEAQQTIRHWTDVHSPDDLAAHARRFDWQEEWVYTDEVIRRVMASGDHADDFDGDWDAYHAWYLSGGHVPDHGTSRWPVIEAPTAAQPDGYLDDGWHRLHSYVRAGDPIIPVLRFRPAARRGIPTTNPTRP